MDIPVAVHNYLSCSKHNDIYQILVSLNQTHLFRAWDPQDVAQINAFFAQVRAFHVSYPGGLHSYHQKAQQLLKEAELGTNPFDGMVPHVPDGENLEFMSEPFLKAERLGALEAKKAAFVLVAGGMGERLGYNGIKVALPSETTSNMTFLELYLRSIMAMQKAMGNEASDNDASSTSDDTTTTTTTTTTTVPGLHIPLAIMTSAETHEKTLHLLESNDYFGFPRDRLHLMKQDKVPCLSDARGTMTRDPTNKYALMTKPHGHGDVHYLLHQTGLAKQWYEEENRKWVCFFQDTNGLVFRSMCASLGISALRDFDSNSITGPRQAKQAMGAICKLINTQDQTAMTTNVEYNLLDPMLRGSPELYPHGDENDPTTGCSPFPGNMNQLIFKLSTYVTTLSKHSGLVPEFVNPKYTDDTRTTFKKPTRLECMMQDLPRQFIGTSESSMNVGFTSIVGGVRFYNPVKNNVVDAFKKQENGVSPACSASGEHLMYANVCQTLKLMGKNIVDLLVGWLVGWLVCW